jgi:hypothetical protein
MSHSPDDNTEFWLFWINPWQNSKGPVQNLGEAGTYASSEKICGEGAFRAKMIAKYDEIFTKLKSNNPEMFKFYAEDDSFKSTAMFGKYPTTQELAAESDLNNFYTVINECMLAGPAEDADEPMLLQSVVKGRDLHKL